MEPSVQTSAASGILASIAGIGYIALIILSLVCWIKVLIALFKKEGAGLGILGILCSIYAFIWGWMKSTELGLKKTMVWWTISLLGALVCAGIASAGIAGAVMSNPDFQKAMEDAKRQQQEQTAPAVPTPAPQ